MVLLTEFSRDRRCEVGRAVGGPGPSGCAPDLGRWSFVGTLVRADGVRRASWLGVVVDWCRLGLVDRGRPAGQQTQLLLRGRAGLGAVRGEREGAFGRQFHRVEGQRQLTDDWMADLLDAGAVQPHVMPGPAGGELAATGAQLSDERGEGLIVRVAAGLGA